MVMVRKLGRDADAKIQVLRREEGRGFSPDTLTRSTQWSFLV
jgi:hypothetical protein